VPAISLELGAISYKCQLNFGISSQHYDTTAKTPTGGWPELSASASAGIEIKAGYDWPPLVSQFAFSTVDKGGERGIGSVSVESRVSFKDNRAYLYYFVANSGQQAASVLINLATDKEQAKILPIASNFVSIGPKDAAKYQIATSAPITTEPATIVIMNEMGQISLMDRAGVYSVLGGSRFRDDLEFWGSRAERR
jgi:hypothetical protein